MLNIYSLQELIDALKSDRSAENTSLLHIVDMIVAYHNRPAQEITISDIQQHMRYFPLYLSYRRIPLNAVDLFVELYDSLLAKDAMMQREHALVQNCISKDASVQAHPVAGEESILMPVAF